MGEKWHAIWLKLKKYLLNKYFVVCVIFAVIMLFVGEHTLIARIENAHRINQLKRELRGYKERIVQKEHSMQVILNCPDSVERYAREHYYMKEDNEDIFLIDEED